MSLIEHGFRLPSAFDHRPLGFEELQLKLKWTAKDDLKNPLALSSSLLPKK
jgi:hypothetical protein